MNRFQRGIVICLALAFLNLTSPLAGAHSERAVLTEVTGTVLLNGRPAATGDAVPSGSTLDTEQTSSAVVSLAKLGRVEATAETSMMLRFDDRSIFILLSSGSVSVTAGEGVEVIIERAN